jgi:hypothetical protein
MGPLPVTEAGIKFILTCQDNLSKYLIASPLLGQTADEVPDAFVKNIVLIYGIPNEIVTDQGTNFMSEVFKRICKLLNCSNAVIQELGKKKHQEVHIN